MAYGFPEGSKFYFSQTFASAKTLSAITNANPAVATSTAHGYTNGTEILLSSGWEDATDTVYRVANQSTNAFDIDGLYTLNTSLFAAGAGANSSAFAVSNWVEIPQVLSIASSGGDPRFTDINPLARRNGIRVPTGFNATSITLTLGFDSTLTAYQTMLVVSRSLTKVAFKMTISGAGPTYGYGYLSVSEVPSLNVNQANQVQASFSLLGRAVSYGS